MTDATSYPGVMAAVGKLKARAIEVQLLLDVSDWAVANAGNYPNDTDVPRFLDDKSAYETRRRGEVDHALASFEETVRPYSEFPDYATFGTMADEVAGALQHLVMGPGGHTDFVAHGDVGPSAAYDGFTSLDGLIPTWAGVAASTFKTSFAPRIPAVVWNEFSAVEGLRGPLRAAENHWREAQKDVCKLVDAASAGVEACLPTGGGLGAAAALGLVGAIIGVVALPFTLGASEGVVAAGFTVMTSTVGLAGAAAGATSPVTVSGEKPLDVLAHFVTKLDDLNQTIILNEIAIGEGLRHVQDDIGGLVSRPNPHNNPHIPDDDTIQVRDAGRAGSYTMPRPALADVPHGQVTDPHQVGHPAGLS